MESNTNIKNVADLDEIDGLTFESEWNELVSAFRGLDEFFKMHFDNRHDSIGNSSVLGCVKKVTAGTDYFALFCAVCDYQIDVRKMLIPMLDGLVSTFKGDFLSFISLENAKQREILTNFSWIFVNVHGEKKDKRGWSHRFENIDRLLCMLTIFREIHRARGMKSRAATIYAKANGNFKIFLEKFFSLLRNNCGGCSKCKEERLCERIFPEEKISSRSCLKRYLLFLRWVVRKDENDLGLWDFIDKKKLLIPLDLTVKRILTRTGVVSNEDGCVWKEVVRITKFFRLLNAEDPIKFDILVSRLGILKFCVKEVEKSKCYACPLSNVCKKKGSGKGMLESYLNMI